MKIQSKKQLDRCLRQAAEEYTKRTEAEELRREVDLRAVRSPAPDESFRQEVSAPEPDEDRCQTVLHLHRREKRRKNLQRVALFLVCLLGLGTAVALPKISAAGSDKIVRTEFSDGMTIEYKSRPGSQQQEGGFFVCPEDRLPAGYHQVDCLWFMPDYRLTYFRTDPEGENPPIQISFRYQWVKGSQIFTCRSSKYPPVHSECRVNANPADFFEDPRAGGNNTLVWLDQERSVLFVLEGPADLQTLLQIAEGVVPENE